MPLETDSSDGKIKITDTERVDSALPTINFLIENQAKIILISHLGRPKNGQPDPKLSLRPIFEYLKSKNLDISFVEATTGEMADSTKQNLQPGQILLLENLRFDEREKKNDSEFARELSRFVDVYINEAFSVSHRADASTEGITHFLPSFAGIRLRQEVENLASLLENPKRPFVIVLGGAKISDKVSAAQNLANIADIILVGGAVANNFLKAEGLEIYRSFVEEVESAGASNESNGDLDYVNFAKKLIEKHKTERMLKDGYIPLPKILYPIDVIAAPILETNDSNQTQVIDLTHNMQDQEESVQLVYLDVGPKTRQLYAEIIAQAGTVFWNGPMGVWENPLFSSGTQTVAQAIADNPGHTVVGGGDSLAAIRHFSLTDSFKFVSIAGGAALEFLGGEVLPGLKPMMQDS